MNLQLPMESINKRDESGNTELHRVIRRYADYSESYIQELISAGANIYICNNNGDRPIDLALYRKDVKLIRLLLSDDMSVVDTNNESLIHRCVRIQSVELLELFLPRCNLDIQNSYRQTALHIAVEYKNVEIGRLLISHGANQTVLDEADNTPLTKAIYEGNILMVSLFNLSGNEDSVMHAAILSNNVCMVEYILSRGIDVSRPYKNGTNPLCDAINHNSYDIVKVILDNGANVNMQDAEGSTPLHCVLRREYNDILDLLLSHKDIDLRLVVSEIKMSCVHLAARHNTTRALESLCKFNIDINARNARGETPLFWAISLNLASNVKILLDHGADLYICDNDNVSGLEWIMYTCNLEIINIILDRGVDINSQTNTGETLLHWAVLKKKIDVVKMLLSRGADITIESRIGHCSLAKAVLHTNLDMIRLLDGGVNAEGYECPICMESYKYVFKMHDTTSAQQHLVCGGCLYHLVAIKSLKCPLCRSESTPKLYH